MNTFQEIFKVKYPISVMAMNQVSDITLAIAVRYAGALPSLSIYNYPISPTSLPGTLPFLLSADLDKYYAEFGDFSIQISTGVEYLFSDRLLQLYSKVGMVEIVRDSPKLNQIDENINFINEFKLRVRRLQDSGVFVVFKSLLLPGEKKGVTAVIESDGIILKGPDGAGRGNSDGHSLNFLFDEYRKVYPELKIIVSGGIGNSNQVKDYMCRGAFAIGAGTLFAACKESKVSLETKLKMVSSSFNDVRRLTHGANQNALVFKEVEVDGYNNTYGLIHGISGTKEGHIFAGSGIDYIDEIKSASDVVLSLVKDL